MCVRATSAMYRITVAGRFEEQNNFLPLLGREPRIVAKWLYRLRYTGTRKSKKGKIRWKCRQK
jgi:hypothetical protein